LNPEWQEGSGPFAIPHEYHCAGIEVHYYGQVAMPLLDSNFINGQPANILEIDFPEALLEVSLLRWWATSVMVVILFCPECGGDFKCDESTPPIFSFENPNRVSNS